MQHSDVEKKAFCYRKIVRVLDKIDTWEEMKTFINAISPAKLKTLLKNAYKEAQDLDDIAVTQAQEKKVADTEAETEMNNL